MTILEQTTCLTQAASKVSRFEMFEANQQVLLTTHKAVFTQSDFLRPEEMSLSCCYHKVCLHPADRSNCVLSPVSYPARQLSCQTH